MFELLEISLLDEEGNKVNIGISTNESSQRGISSCWKLEFDSVNDSKKLLTLSIKMPNLDGKNISSLTTAESIDGLKLFRNIFIHLKINHDKEIKSGV